jgi:hypothetical protein
MKGSGQNTVTSVTYDAWHLKPLRRLFVPLRIRACGSCPAPSRFPGGVLYRNFGGSRRLLAERQRPGQQTRRDCAAGISACGASLATVNRQQRLENRAYCNHIVEEEDAAQLGRLQCTDQGERR